MIYIYLCPVRSLSLYTYTYDIHISLSCQVSLSLSLSLSLSPVSWFLPLSLFFLPRLSRALSSESALLTNLARQSPISLPEFSKVLYTVTFCRKYTTALNSENSRSISEYSTISLSIMQYSDYVFFVIFAFEFAIKILEHGVLWEHELAYFRQGWNVLDFLILLLQLLDMIGVDGLNSLRVLRVLSSKVLYIVVLQSIYTRALTFRN